MFPEMPKSMRVENRDLMRNAPFRRKGDGPFKRRRNLQESKPKGIRVIARTPEYVCPELKPCGPGASLGL